MTESRRIRQTRAQRKEETRQALIVAAFVSFSRDGYHGSSLEGIANEAGFSKGAVYSNFSSKSVLFLACMDFNLEVLKDAEFDPFDPAPTAGAAALPSDAAAPSADELNIEEIEDQLKGFSLATLEFVAVAARDDDLREQLRSRIRRLAEAHSAVADAYRHESDTLTAPEQAHLMLALDQGWSLLALVGLDEYGESLKQAGTHRLLGLTGQRASGTGPESAWSAAQMNAVRQVAEQVYGQQRADPDSG